MIYYYKEKKYWFFGLEGASRETVRSLKGIVSLKRNVTNKEWYVEASEAAIPLLKEFAERWGIPEVDGLSLEREGCKAQIPTFKEILSKEDIALLIKSLPLLKQPRGYQIEYLHYAVNRGNTINGSDCGLGKTLCTIFLAEMMDSFPCMVVCPASVKRGWEKEWKECNPERSVSVISSDSKDEEFGADVLIINYDILGKKVVKDNGKTLVEVKLKNMKKKSFSLVVADEIHFLKNNKSIRSKTFRKFARKSPWVIGLTGTLIMNRPSEIINILALIGRLKELAPDDPYHFYFLERYCNMKKGFFGNDTTGSSNIPELHRLLQQSCYFRLNKRDALHELPPTTEDYVECEISNMKVYNKAEREFIEFMLEIDKTSEAARAAARAEALVKMGVLKQLSLIGKTPSIKKYISEWLEANEDEKLLVFASQSMVLEDIQALFKGSSLIIGSTSSKKREGILKSFYEDPKSRLLFANMGCLGTGVDGLQKVCSNMFILEFPARPSDLVQVISRLERSGQENPVFIKYLLSSSTIDKKLWEMLKGKKEITDNVNKGFVDDTSLMLVNAYEETEKQKP